MQQNSFHGNRQNDNRLNIADTYSFGQDRYYDLLREAEDYRRERRAAVHPAASRNRSTFPGLRNLMRMLLMTFTHS